MSKGACATLHGNGNVRQSSRTSSRLLVVAVRTSRPGLQNEPPNYSRASASTDVSTPRTAHVEAEKGAANQQAR